MTVTIVLPAQLRDLVRDRGSASGEADTVRVEPAESTVGGALRTLGERHPAVLDRIVTEQFQVRPHVNLFVGLENIRWNEGLDTPVDDGAEVTILPAVSGG